MSRIKDLTGMKLGMITVIEPYGRDKNGNCTYLCKCDCGNEKVITSRYLLNTHNGTTRNCGCIAAKARSENMKKINGFYHGHSKERLHRIYNSMKGRCLNQNNYDYQYYGGKGVSVCDEWLRSYEKFKDWAMSNGYQEDLTLDRIDVNGNYEPSNCRWVSMKVQSNNKTVSVYITHHGETHTLKQWSEITGINYSTICKRYQKGKSPDEILKKKARKTHGTESKRN